MFFNLNVSRHETLSLSLSFSVWIHVLNKHSFGWISCVVHEAVLMLYAKWIPMKGFYQLNWTNNDEIFSSFIPSSTEFIASCGAMCSVGIFLAFITLMALKFHRNSIAGLKILSQYAWVPNGFPFNNIVQTIFLLVRVCVGVGTIIYWKIWQQVNALQKYKREANR